MATQEQDTFATGSRGAANGLGTLTPGSTVTSLSPASNGDNWIALACPSAFAYSAGTSQGQSTGSNVANFIALEGSVSGHPKQMYDSLVQADFQATSNGTNDSMGVFARSSDVNNLYKAIRNNANQLVIIKTVGGVNTTIGTPFSFTAGTAPFTIKFQVQGFGLNGTANNLQAKIWATGGAEPGWQVTTTDASLTNPGYVGVQLKGNINGSTQSVSNFIATDPSQYTPAPSYNVTQELPVGATIYFVPNTPAPLSQQTITDLQGWGNGVWIREQLQVQSFETAPGFYNMAVLDDLVYRCNQAGIKICAGLQGFPSWYLTIRGTDGATVTAGTGDFPDPTMFSNLATFLATRYNGKNGYGFVDEWQIGNEEYDSACTGITNTSQRDVLGFRLATAVNAVYPAIRAASPTCSIAVNAVRKIPTLALTHIINWTTNFLTTLNKTIQDFRMDMHFYTDGSFSSDPGQQNADRPSIFTELSTIQGLLNLYGFSNARMMVGEFGPNYYDDGSGTVVTNTWAQGLFYTQEILDACRNFPNCHAFIFTMNPFTVVNFGTNPVSVNASGSPKSIALSMNGVYQYLPAYFLIQYYMQNRGLIPWTPPIIPRSLSLTASNSPINLSASNSIISLTPIS